MTPIYDYLRARGCKVEGGYIVVGEWPVQFLPTANPLEQEAVTEAIETEVENVKTRVVSAEHLVAMALRTGRLKGHNRILQFLEQNAVDRNRLESILERHGLVSRWEAFERRYPGGPSE